MAETISSNPNLDSALIQTAQTAFSQYVQRKLLKSLPTPVEAPSPNSDGLDHFDAILAKDTADPEWAKSAREKEEKFAMYLSSLSKSSAAIRTAEKRLASGETGVEGVKDLVDGAADVLGPYLGETVRSWRFIET